MASIRKFMLQKIFIKSYSDIRTEKQISRNAQMLVGKIGGCIKKLEFRFIHFGFFQLIQISTL